MLNYFEISPDFTLFADQWFLNDPVAANGERVEADVFIDGVPYRGPIPVRVAIGNPGREVQFSLSAFDMPVVSHAVANAVRRIAPDDAEFFPVEIADAKGSYEIMNVVNLRDCLDEARSDFTIWTEEDGDPSLTGRYQMLIKTVIDTQRAGGAHLFRLSKSGLELFVSDVIKAELEDRPNLGITFRPAF